MSFDNFPTSKRPPPLDKRTGKVTIPELLLPKIYKEKDLSEMYINPIEDTIITSILPPPLPKA